MPSNEWAANKVRHFAALPHKSRAFFWTLSLMTDLQNSPCNGIRQPNFYVRVFFLWCDPFLGPLYPYASVSLLSYEQSMFDCIHISATVADRSHSIGIARCWWSSSRTSHPALPSPQTWWASSNQTPRPSKNREGLKSNIVPSLAWKVQRLLSVLFGAVTPETAHSLLLRHVFR